MPSFAYWWPVLDCWFHHFAAGFGTRLWHAFFRHFSFRRLVALPGASTRWQNRSPLPCASLPAASWILSGSLLCSFLWFCRTRLFHGLEWCAAFVDAVIYHGPRRLCCIVEQRVVGCYTALDIAVREPCLLTSISSCLDTRSTTCFLLLDLYRHRVGAPSCTFASAMPSSLLPPILGESMGKGVGLVIRPRDGPFQALFHKGLKCRVMSVRRDTVELKLTSRQHAVLSFLTARVRFLALIARFTGTLQWGRFSGVFA